LKLSPNLIAQYAHKQVVNHLQPKLLDVYEPHGGELEGQVVIAVVNGAGFAINEDRVRRRFRGFIITVIIFVQPRKRFEDKIYQRVLASFRRVQAKNFAVDASPIGGVVNQSEISEVANSFASAGGFLDEVNVRPVHLGNNKTPRARIFVESDSQFCEDQFEGECRGLGRGVCCIFRIVIGIRISNDIEC